MTQQEMLLEIETLRRRVAELEAARKEFGKMEEALRAGEERLRSILDSLHDFVFVINPEGVFTDYHQPPDLQKLYVSPKEFIGRHYKDVLPQDVCLLLEEAIHSVERTAAVVQFDYTMEIAERPEWFNAKVSKRKNCYGGFDGVTIVCRDITERKKAEETLRRSDERYRTLVERSNLGIFVSSIEGFLIHVNPGMAQMAGYENVEDLMGTPAERLYTDPSDRKRLLKELLEKGSVKNFEVCVAKKDGTRHWVSLSAVLQRDETGKPMEIHGIAEDVTERRTSGEKIKAALEEKEVLLREIHHRVKNNLAVVSGLLGFQSRHTKDEYHRGMFIESQDRIRSMALAHEKLYQAENLSAINSRDYLTGLARHLHSAMGHVGSDVKLQTQIADVNLDLETGVTLGFIVTELVSNCLKHAFPDGRSGNISLALKEIEDSTLELSVADDGVGLPEDVQLNKPGTLGLDLLRIFCRQLRGHLEVRRQGGTEIVVRFSRKL